MPDSINPACKRVADDVMQDPKPVAIPDRETLSRRESVIEDHGRGKLRNVAEEYEAIPVHEAKKYDKTKGRTMPFSGNVWQETPANGPGG